MKPTDSPRCGGSEVLVRTTKDCPGCPDCGGEGEDAEQTWTVMKANRVPIFERTGEGDDTVFQVVVSDSQTFPWEQPLCPASALSSLKTQLAEAREALDGLVAAAGDIGREFDKETGRNPDSPWVPFAKALAIGCRALSASDSKKGEEARSITEMELEGA